MSEIKIPDEVRNNLPPNSITKPKPAEKPKMEAVVTGGVSIQKTSLWGKFKKNFLPGDVKDIRKYAMQQVIIPKIKDTIMDMTAMCLYGNTSRKRTGSYNSPYRSEVSYSPVHPVRPALSESNRAVHDFRPVVFNTFEDARKVADYMLDYLDRFGEVTVAGFYDLCRIRPDYMDDQYGWRSFSKLEPRAVRDGYVLDIFPEPIYLGGK